MWLDDALKQEGFGLQVLFFLASLVAGIVVTYAFHRLQKKGAASAESERLKRAHTEVVDVLEGYIINQQKLSEGAIVGLISAAGREHSVNLWTRCTPISVLEDAALRIQRSRHLGVEPKTKYSGAIETLIRAILETQEEAERPKPPIVVAASDLEHAIASRDWNLVDKHASILAQAIQAETGTPRGSGGGSIQFGLSGFAGLATTVTVLALGLNVFEGKSSFWILLGAVIGFVILAVIVFVFVSNLGTSTPTRVDQISDKSDPQQ